MRHWLFHPLVFYPLVFVVAAGLILFSLGPQLDFNGPQAQSGRVVDGVVILEGNALGEPEGSPEQVFYVSRQHFRPAESLRIAVLPNQPPPTPAERGVRILLTPQTGALLSETNAVVEVSYRPLSVLNAYALAISLQGIGPVEWVTQPLDSLPGTLRFHLPAQIAVDSIGLRAISDNTDMNYGTEITRIRITPTRRP